MQRWTTGNDRCKPREWFIKSGERHGFYSNRNQVEYLKTATEFLRDAMIRRGRTPGRSQVADLLQKAVDHRRILMFPPHYPQLR